MKTVPATTFKQEEKGAGFKAFVGDQGKFLTGEWVDPATNSISCLLEEQQ